MFGPLSNQTSSMSSSNLISTCKVHLMKLFPVELLGVFERRLLWKTIKQLAFLRFPSLFLGRHILRESYILRIWKVFWSSYRDVEKVALYDMAQCEVTSLSLIYLKKTFWFKQWKECDFLASFCGFNGHGRNQDIFSTFSPRSKIWH